MQALPSVCVRLWCSEDYCDLCLLRDSTALIRSGSYTRRRWDDDLKNSEGSASTNRTSNYQRRLAALLRGSKLPSLISGLPLRLISTEFCPCRVCFAWPSRRRQSFLFLGLCQESCRERHAKQPAAFLHHCLSLSCNCSPAVIVGYKKSFFYFHLNPDYVQYIPMLCNRHGLLLRARQMGTLLYKLGNGKHFWSQTCSI